MRIKIVIIVLLFSSCKLCAQSFYIIAPSITASCNTIVDVPIKVTGFQNILSLQGTIGWDPAKLHFQSIENFGPSTLGWGTANFGTNNSTAGKLTFSWNDLDLGGETLNDSTILFTMRFISADNINATSSAITFENSPTLIEVVNSSLDVVLCNKVNGICNFICTAVTYTFTGNGNWNNALNWFNNTIPPAVLSSGSQIVIDPLVNGECVLNGLQNINQGASILVKSGKKLRIIGNLLIQ